MPYKLADTAGHGRFLEAAFGGGRSNVVTFSARQHFAAASNLTAQRLSHSFSFGEPRTVSL